MRPELAELPPYTLREARASSATQRLRSALGDRIGVSPDEIVLGQGTAALFGALASAFGVQTTRAPASAMAVTPTSHLYKWSFRSRGVKLVEVPLDASFGVNWEMMERAVQSMRPNLLVLGAPNDPTGVPLDAAPLEKLLPVAENAAGDPALVIVDESARSPATSLRALRKNHPAVAIVRTLGQNDVTDDVAWLEVDASLARELEKMPGFAPSALSIAQATNAVARWDEVTEAAERAIERSASLAARIAELDGWSVTPTHARFLWAEAPCDASVVLDAVATAELDGVSGGGVGRLARRVRIDAPRDEGLAARLVDVLRECSK